MSDIPDKYSAVACSYTMLCYAKQMARDALLCGEATEEVRKAYHWLTEACEKMSLRLSEMSVASRK